MPKDLSIANTACGRRGISQLRRTSERFFYRVGDDGDAHSSGCFGLLALGLMEWGLMELAHRLIDQQHR